MRNKLTHNSETELCKAPPVEPGTEDDEALLIKRTRRVRTREAWVGWTQVVANVLVPLALIVAVLNLVEQAREARRDASARQIELFYSEGVAKSQATLFAIWLDQNIEVLRAARRKSFIDEFVTVSYTHLTLPTIA